MNTLTPLRSLGYSVLPSPRHVDLSGGFLPLSRPCRILSSLKDTGLDSLALALHNRGIQTAPDTPNAIPITIAIIPRTVATGLTDTRDDQAYLLTISSHGVTLTGNSPSGAFHGIQTLIQLIESSPDFIPSLPLGSITDWPSLEWRFIHWDTKHHQDRLCTLKRYIDEMARFKLNAISFELEDKFEYPSHPVIGAPGAFTTAELAALTRYARERHIELVPNVQAPAHLTYVLKHPEFAHLRCDGSNYMICMDEPEARRLLFSMYDDLCRATPGASFFHVSTDEVYYAGICGKFRHPYTPENRSLTLIDYINAAHAFLKKRGRRILIWAEFPILTQHLHLLPPDIIDGIIGGDGPFIDEENRLGIRQLAYSPIQGEELLFPCYFPCDPARGRPAAGRLAEAVNAVLCGKASRGNPIGTFAASWDDSGLHNETFWLGWATMAQCGWNPAGTPLDQTMADFLDVFYGRSHQNLLAAYKALHSNARFHESTWEKLPSKTRGPAYGSSSGKRPVGRIDRTLIPPSPPALPALTHSSDFRQRYASALAELPARMAENEALTDSLLRNLTLVSRNRYSLEVLLSISRFIRHHLVMLDTLARVENDFDLAATAHRSANSSEALSHLAKAADRLEHLIADKTSSFDALRRTWEKSQLPATLSAGNHRLLFVMDDVKDHFANRRPDLSYLTAPEDSLALPTLLASIQTLIHDYGTALNHPSTHTGAHEPPPME